MMPTAPVIDRHPEARAPQAGLRSLRKLGCVRASKDDGRGPRILRGPAFGRAPQDDGKRVSCSSRSVLNRFFRRAVVLAALALLPSFSAALAQDYPARPVRVIATSSAGGTSDIFMRALADELHKAMGQPFIIENRPGGAFNIGARACAEAAPDGYTLCIIPGEPLVFNQFLFKNLAFDPENGFEPVTQLFFITQALVVSAALDVKTLPELIALSKAKPGTLSYSTAAVPLGVVIERLKRGT